MSNQNQGADDAAVQLVVIQMLEILDNFDRAFGAVQPANDEEMAVEQEYRQVYDDILAHMDELGVRTIETVGTEFNYEYHQAVMQRPSDEYEEGIVCDELQKGFVIGDKLIRAAMVSVAA